MCTSYIKSKITTLMVLASPCMSNPSTFSTPLGRLGLSRSMAVCVSSSSEPNGEVGLFPCSGWFGTSYVLRSWPAKLPNLFVQIDFFHGRFRQELLLQEVAQH